MGNVNDNIMGNNQSALHQGIYMTSPHSAHYYSQRRGSSSRSRSRNRTNNHSVDNTQAIQMQQLHQELLIGNTYPQQSQYQPNNQQQYKLNSTQQKLMKQDYILQQTQQQSNTNINNNLLHVHPQLLITGRISNYSQSFTSFRYIIYQNITGTCLFYYYRQSFASDNTQSTIYLQPPQFILRSPILLYLINRLIQQFFDLTECLGMVAVKIFKLSLYLVFLFIVVNANILLWGDMECMRQMNNGVIELQKWLMLDTVVTASIVLLLWINKWLIEKYKKRHRRGTKYMKRMLHIVQCSWIGLYCIKFFVLNSLGSCQFFTYTYKHRNQQSLSQTTDNLQQSTNMSIDSSSAQASTFTQTLDSFSKQIIQCPYSMNMYIISYLVFNYISILFLCVFAVQHLV